MNVPTTTPGELAVLRRGCQPAGLVNVRTPVEYRDAYARFARSIPPRLAAGAPAAVGLDWGVLVHPGLLGLPALVRAGLVFSEITDARGMGPGSARAPWSSTGEVDSGGSIEEAH